MPKFYRQNKKRIDPRYFLNETTNRDENINEIDLSNQEDQTFQYNQAMAQKKAEKSDTDEFGRTAFDQLEYEIEALFSDSAFMDTIDRDGVDMINSVIAKVQKSGTGRSADLVPDDVVPATDEEKAQLANAAEQGSEALYSIINQIAGSGQGGASADTDLSKIDRDGDGKISADQLANIATAIKNNQS